MMNPDPEADDAAVIVIRNRRCRALSTPLWRWVGFVCWLSALVVVTLWLPRPWRGDACTVVAVIAGLSFVGLLGAMHHGPVQCVHLGNQLTALPFRTYDPEDIGAVHFAADPAEDYADDGSDRLTEAAFDVPSGRRLRLVVDVGDAARIRAWASRVGVRVVDPDGYSRPDGDDENGRR